MKNSLRLLMLLGCCMSSLSVTSAPPKWQITQGTKANFTIDGMMGIDVDGSLEFVSSSIVFDPANPQAAVLDATLTVGTIKTGIGKRDKHLKSGDYFDAGKYPSIIFHATSVVRKGAGYEAIGNLKIKSATRKVTIPFTFTPQGNNATFNGRFNINRSDYGIGSGKETGMGNEVRISLKVPVKKVG